MIPLLIIPAKAHSERIPGKNYQPLNGKTPLRRALEVANVLVEPATTVVTADRLEPDEIRLDPQLGYVWLLSDAHKTQKMAEVVKDVLQRVAGPAEQPVLLLQPTQPLRQVKHLQEALWHLQTHNSVATVVETRPAQKCYFLNGHTLASVTYMDRAERDQACRPTYTNEGTVYGFTRAWFLNTLKFITDETYAIVVPAEETCYLDTPHEWAMAALRLKALEGVR